jgi:hypothetical protein
MRPLANREHFLRGLFLAAALAVFLPSPARADDEEDDDDTVVVEPLKTDIFRDLLFRKDIKPLRGINDLRADPNNTIIILLGQKSVNYLQDWNIIQAVERGASLLIASDQSSAGSRLKAHLGVEITGELVFADGNDCYRGRSFYPFVTPLNKFEQVENSSPKKLFQALDSDGPGALVTNYPSYLNIDRKHFASPMPLAGYPFSAHRANMRDANLDPQTDYFAAGGQLGEGRYLILADHSIFVNSMVWRPEINSNLFFMQDCVGWLQGEEKKSRCLFIEEGEILTEFELPMPEPQWTWWKILQKVPGLIDGPGNDFVREVQKHDGFNDLLLQLISYRWIMRALLFLFTAFVILFGLLTLVRNWTRADPARALVTPELAAMIPRGNVLHQRFDGQLDGENVYEAARQLVRDFLAGMDAEPDAHGLPPTLVIEDGYEDEGGLRRRIARLWRIGYDTVPVKVAPEEWKGLTKDLQDVLTDADDGWWKFTPADRK